MNLNSTPPVRVRTRQLAGAAPPDAVMAASRVNQPSDQRKQALRLNVEYRPVASLTPSLRNARTHSKGQLHKLAASLKQFGFNSPILIDGAGEVVAGHGRLEAAKMIGLAEVPTISVSHLTEAEVRAYRVADNRLAQLSDWDDEVLKVELSFLAEIDLDLPEITGFETAEINSILEAAAPTPAPDPATRSPRWMSASLRFCKSATFGSSRSIGCSTAMPRRRPRMRASSKVSRLRWFSRIHRGMSGSPGTSGGPGSTMSSSKPQAR